MKTETTTQARRPRWIIGTAVGIIAAIIGALAGTAPAGAASYLSGGYGRPGAVGTGVVAANGNEYAWTQDRLSAGMSVRIPKLTIYRSPATSGAQNVGYNYALMRWNGSAWVRSNWSQNYFAHIPAGVGSVTVDPGVRLSASYAGSYYMKADVVWATAGGASLGHIPIAFNHASDYRCAAISSGKLLGQCTPNRLGYVTLS